MDLLQNVFVTFSGGVDSGGVPFVGDLIDFRGIATGINVDIEAISECTELIVDNFDYLKDKYDDRLTGIEVFDDAGNLQIGSALLALGRIGYDLFSDPLFAGCRWPISGGDAIDSKIGLDLGSIKIGGGIGFGNVEFDRDNNGELASALFFRLSGEAGFNGWEFGGEIILTEFGPILARVSAGVPVPIGGPTGFVLTGFQGGIVFDGSPLPVIEDPRDLLTNVKIQAPLDLSLSRIADAITNLHRRDGQINDEDGDGQADPRYVWDQGFTLVTGAYLTNQYIANSVGLQMTMGINIGYDLPDYTIALKEEDGSTTVMSVIDALANGDTAIDKLGGSYKAFEGVSGATMEAAINAFNDPANAEDPWGAFQQVLGETIQSNLDIDIDANEFLRSFPFGMQVYALADLEALGFDIGGVGMMFDWSDQYNPKIDIAGELPKSGTLLGILSPVQAGFGMTLDSDGVIEGRNCGFANNLGKGVRVGRGGASVGHRSGVL
ncbi:MAG: hypothetical protein R3C53_08935 [Pirellulaceae bacterium]